MVRYTRPPSPAGQATTRSAPTKHLSDQHRQMAVIKSQANENKGVIWMVKTELAVTDEGDEGAGPLIDMTKVTRSTLAEKPLPRVMNKVLKNTIRKDTEAASCWVLLSPQPSITKPNRTEQNRTKKTPHIDKIIEPELIFSTCHFSFSSV
ncbi:hypothetical protein GOY18_05815 [Aeromonas hydrophila]|uniref:hypothetical protein n=1 Tax=Aeromonas hydrophila TaxID=644 RepID=UPI001C5A79DA|nr:hypothetical protein [Aeromonas hydrophila]MBW3809435.1 hypothetical protein [Aeromonas hydrophila]